MNGVCGGAARTHARDGFLFDVTGHWLHLRDGTGSEGTNDLTITTSAVAKAGDLVTVSGVLELDKDFGAGYVYSVIIENAEIIVE